MIETATKRIEKNAHELSIEIIKKILYALDEALPTIEVFKLENGHKLIANEDEYLFFLEDNFYALIEYEEYELAAECQKWIDTSELI